MLLSYTGIEENEQADKVANEGIVGGSNMRHINTDLPWQEVKNHTEYYATELWRQKWDLTPIINIQNSSTHNQARKIKTCTENGDTQTK